MEKIIQAFIGGGGAGFAGAGGVSFIPHVSVSDTAAIMSAIAGAIIYSAYIYFAQVDK
jgi:hypothetical protein